MSSLNAKAVANEVVANVRKGLKIPIGAVIKKHGYSDSTSKKPKRVLGTEAAQEILDPIVRAMIVERDAVIERMKKMRGKAKYRDLTDAIDKLTKNIQLLGGKATGILNISTLLDESEK